MRAFGIIGGGAALAFTAAGIGGLGLLGPVAGVGAVGNIQTQTILPYLLSTLCCRCSRSRRYNDCSGYVLHALLQISNRPVLHT